MQIQEIKHSPEATIFVVNDQSDIYIAMSHIKGPLFILNAAFVDKSIISTIFSELATNIIKYAGRGFIRMSQTNIGRIVKIEMWAEDNGPGIDKISLAMQDHYTTGNSLGLGLPAVRRMVDDFSIQSEAKNGTVVYVTKNIILDKEDINRPIYSISKKFPQENHVCSDVGLHSEPALGEYVSGDAVLIVNFAGYILLAITDVSGHGLKAHELSTVISTYIKDCACINLNFLLAGLHEKLVGTRGAAVGLLLFDIEAKTFNYLGVGNTLAVRCVGDEWSGISRDGVLGYRLPKFNSQAGFLQIGDIFAMTTDGISSTLIKGFVKENSYMSAQEIAECAAFKLGSERDDSSCIIFKYLN